MKLEHNEINLAEADLEDWLYENPGAIYLWDFSIDRWLARQFSVPSGIIDLLGTGYNQMGDMCLVVIELKKAGINSDALAQVCRYAADIENSLVEIEGLYGPLGITPVRKICIGDSIDSSTMFEANALGVEVIQYSVNYELNLSNSITWTDEYNKKITTEYLRIADSPELVEFRNIAVANLENIHNSQKTIKEANVEEND